MTGDSSADVMVLRKRIVAAIGESVNSSRNHDSGTRFLVRLLWAAEALGLAGRLTTCVPRLWNATAEP